MSVLDGKLDDDNEFAIGLTPEKVALMLERMANRVRFQTERGTRELIVHEVTRTTTDYQGEYQKTMLAITFYEKQKPEETK